MGCCQSSTRDDAQSSPYAPSNAHGDSSSRHITSVPLPVPSTPTPPRTSSHAGRSTATPHAPGGHNHRTRPRPVGLAEQFNQPLRPHVWTSSKRKWTRSALDRERVEFFDTRVTGRAEIWGTLRMAVGLLAEGEMETAQSVLDASGVTVPTGDLVNGAYDEAGNFYQMPATMISDPENMAVENEFGTGGRGREMVVGGGEMARGDGDGDGGEEDDEDATERRREEKGKGVVKSGDLIRVKARLSDRGGPDLVLSLSKEDYVRTLVRRVKEDAGISSKGKLKIAYLGKVLKENETLVAQGWREGHVVNALVFSA